MDEDQGRIDLDLNMHAPSSDDKSLPSYPGLSGEQTQSTCTTQGPAVNQTPGNSQQQSRQPASSQSLQSSRRPVSTSSALPQVSGSSARTRKTYAKQIASGFLPSKKEMAADRAASNDVARRIAESKERIVKVAGNVALAMSNSNNNGTSSDPRLLELTIKEKELDVKAKELDLSQRRLKENRQRLHAGAFERAKMMQDFIRTGLDLDKARDLTDSLLGPQQEGTNTAAGGPGSPLVEDVTHHND
ncbi:hypothetical protein PCANC_04928 [Puccinia coronata f. sp. avenae]|uniref:No apical meristem-associated C-terminal domain-containing protein n=1 Tax=Puccinia coronata f. sp. avenae TaxID=200324 RepID=A0A2N5VWI1_9BASI|nr:hypothetical protein PCANC_04928 [Puccinia coronata f. sp. avenae]